MVTGSWDDTIRLFNIYNDYETIRTINLGYGIYSVVLLDKNTIACLVDNKDILIYDTRESDKLLKILEGHDNEIISALRLSNGSLVTGSVDKSIKIWK